MDKKEGKGCCACFQKMSKAELLFLSFPMGKLCSFFFPQESVEQMRSKAKQGGAIRSNNKNRAMQRRAIE